MSLSKSRNKTELEQYLLDKRLRNGCLYCGEDVECSCYSCYDDYDDYSECGCYSCSPYGDWYDSWLNSPERVREKKLDEIFGDKVQTLGDFYPQK